MKKDLSKKLNSTVSNYQFPKKQSNKIMAVVGILSGIGVIIIIVVVSIGFVGSVLEFINIVE